MSVGLRVQDGHGLKGIMASQWRISDVTMASNPIPHLLTDPQMGKINKKNLEKPT